MKTGDQAFELVRAYSDIGYHSTASLGDKRTAKWLVTVLENLGASTSIQTFEFVRFHADVTLESCNTPIRSMPLFYAFAGNILTENIALGSIEAHEDEISIYKDIDQQILNAKANRYEALVLATQCPTSGLCAINAEFDIDFDFPVVLIANVDQQKIHTRGASIKYSGGVDTDQAENIIARFQGPAASDAIVITTPVSGWFNCAGERGCGVALAMLLAKRLSRKYAVDLIMTSGHELGMLGGYAASDQYTKSANCILHLGSCIATHSSTLTGVCTANTSVSSAIAKSLGSLVDKLMFPADQKSSDDWIGESKCWAPHGIPMLSIAGINPYFHTPDDLPQVVTTPELLSDAFDTIHNASLFLASN